MFERVVTAGLHLDKQTLSEFESSMIELRRLVETAGGVVVQEFVQRRPAPDPATHMGCGKIEQVAEAIKPLKVRTVVFNDDLAPAQQKNVEKILNAKVIDRTRLILDIFAQRARTKEGQLQVELAQLNYLVPRLTGSWRGFSQQMGGIGTRGPGEKKIEVERRYVRERIKRLKIDIEAIRQHRDRARLGRAAVPLSQVALIGYTNVGKSTLLNSLINKEAVYADDKLFATLDPTTRRLKLPSGRTVLVTDTVGFIQKLPHTLVAAFRGTLEEVVDATLLVHLVDAAAPNWEEQRRTVLDVVKSLGAESVPMIEVFNKGDLLPLEEQTRLLQKGVLVVSGQNGSGLPAFLKALEDKLDEHMIEKSFKLPFSKRKLLAQIHAKGFVLNERYAEDGVYLTVRLEPAAWEKISFELKK